MRKGWGASALLAVVLVAGGFGSNEVRAQSELVSFMPAEGLPRFVYEELSITTMPSIIGPRRMVEKITLGDYGLEIAREDGDTIYLESESETISITVRRRSDSNSDGVEDVEICMLTRSKAGSYNSMQRVRLQKFTADTPLIAMAAGYRSSDGNATGSDAAC